jgi:hypothetical protein
MAMRSPCWAEAIKTASASEIGRADLASSIRRMTPDLWDEGLAEQKTYDLPLQLAGDHSGGRGRYARARAAPRLPRMLVQRLLTRRCCAEA